MSEINLDFDSIFYLSALIFNNIPNWLEASRGHVIGLDAWARSRNFPIDLQALSSRVSGQIESQTQELAKQALGVAIGTLSSLVDTIFVIVMAFYMLLYGGQLWRGLIEPQRMTKRSPKAIG